MVLAFRLKLLMTRSSLSNLSEGRPTAERKSLIGQHYFVEPVYETNFYSSLSLELGSRISLAVEESIEMLTGNWSLSGMAAVRKKEAAHSALPRKGTKESNDTVPYPYPSVKG